MNYFLKRNNIIYKLILNKTLKYLNFNCWIKKDIYQNNINKNMKNYIIQISLMMKSNKKF